MKVYVCFIISPFFQVFFEIAFCKHSQATLILNTTLLSLKTSKDGNLYLILID